MRRSTSSTRATTGKGVAIGQPATRSKKLRTAAAVVALSAALIGCSRAGVFHPGQSIQGPGPVVKGETIEDVDLITELWGGFPPRTVEMDELEFAFLEGNTRLALAYDKFYERPGGDKRLQRNRIQGRLLQASDQACGVYINFMRKIETEFEFGLGALTVLFAGAGAIVPHMLAAQTLSGSAAITEGTRAEFRQAFFSNLATHVIVPGIEHRRKIILEGNSGTDKGILGNRTKTLVEYPVEMAVKDALFYHAHCNLMAGLVEASELIELAKRPGIDAMNMALKEMGETRTLVEVLTGKPNFGAAVATKDLPQLYVLLDDSQQTKSNVQSDVVKRSEIPTDREADAIAQSARVNWKPKIDADVAAAMSTFEISYGKTLESTNEIAAIVLKLTKEIKNKEASKDKLSIKSAELAVEQAKIRSLMHELENAVQTLGSGVESALMGFENAMRAVRAKIEAEADLKKALASGDADAIAKAKSKFESKAKDAVAAAKTE